ncbi:sensor histidine kinase [Eubacteriales bacterium OttesenSCG-928-A19]|nr:sensor histidine kinase [Eubacteriales bacterium OttesenSCG-928-A19]
MALTIVFLLAFSLSLLARDYKNKYSLLFASMSIALAVALFTVVVELHRGARYIVSPLLPFGAVESQLFFALNRMLKLPLSRLQIVRNACVSVYLGMNLLFVRSFQHNLLGGARPLRGMGGAVLVGMGCYIALSFVFYHPVTAYQLYLLQYRVDGARLARALAIVDALMTCCAMLCLLCPVAFILYNYARGRLTIFFEPMLSLVLTLAFFDTLFSMLFWVPSFRTSSESVLRHGFWRGISVDPAPVFYTSLLPIIAIFALAGVTYLLSRFRTVYLFSRLQEQTIRKKLRGLYLNLRDVMHSQKNLMLTMRFLSEEALADYGTEDGRRKLERIQALADEQLRTMTRTLDSIKMLKIKAIRQDFMEIVEGALRASTLPPGVRVERDYRCATAICGVDPFHMERAIVNLLANATQALIEAKPEDPCIRLSVDLSDNWVSFTLRDNGCGIPRRVIHKVFEPYFSLRPKQNSWGVGLSYVAQVVKSHYGYIRIRSRENAYTQVELLLTRSRQ